MGLDTQKSDAHPHLSLSIALDFATVFKLDLPHSIGRVYILATQRVFRIKICGESALSDIFCNVDFGYTA